MKQRLPDKSENRDFLDLNRSDTCLVTVTLSESAAYPWFMQEEAPNK